MAHSRERFLHDYASSFSEAYQKSRPFYRFRPIRKKWSRPELIAIRRPGDWPFISGDPAPHFRAVVVHRDRWRRLREGRTLHVKFVHERRWNYA